MKKSAFLLPIALLVALPAILNADTVVEEIIARINNQIITRSEYVREREQQKQEAQQQDPANADKAYAQKERDVLRGLIDQQLLLEKGKDLGINADTDLIKRLDEIRKDTKLETMEDVDKAAQAQVVSFEDFKQNLKNQIITQKVISQEVGSHLQVTKEEEQQFYDEHKSEMQQPEQIRLSEILIAAQKAPAPGDKTPVTDPTPEEIAAAEAKAKDLLEQIHKGAKFEDVAKKESSGPTAAQGGDLGYFPRGQLAKELEEKTFVMKKGEVSDVVRVKQGFVILKVTDHPSGGIPTVKEVEPRLQEAIYMERLQPALREYLTRLREEAFIDIKQGYVDTGASPKQTKPIETSVKEANAKKLKKKKKFGVI